MPGISFKVITVRQGFSCSVDLFRLPRWLSGKESTCQCKRYKRCRFDPWRGKWPSTPVFLPGESPWTKEPGGLQSMGSQIGTRLSNQVCACTHTHTPTHPPLSRDTFAQLGGHLKTYLLHKCVLSLTSARVMAIQPFTCSSILGY